MKRHRISMLAGIAAAALAISQAQAIDLNAGPANVSVNGGGGGASVNANVNAGPDVNANVSVSDDGQGADVSANVDSNATTQSTGGDALEATVDIDEGIETDIDILKLRRGGHAASADVDILTGEDDKVLDAFVDTGVGDANAVVRFSNGDGGTNVNIGSSLDAASTSNDAMIDLTIGGGGVAGGAAVDTGAADANVRVRNGTGGVLDLADDLTATLLPADDGTVPGSPPDGIPPDTGVVPPDGITPDPNEIRDTFNTLSAEDVAALKVNCHSVLGNSSSFSNSAVAICKLALGM